MPAKMQNLWRRKKIRRLNAFFILYIIMNRVKQNGKWYIIHITNYQTFECELIEDPDYVEPKEVVIKHVVTTESDLPLDCNVIKTVRTEDL